MRRLSIIVLAALLVTGCKKNERDTESQYLRINSFVWNYLNAYYVWRDYIPDSETPTSENPKEYFPRLKYHKDNWSLITDDYYGLKNSVNNTGRTFGYTILTGRFVDDNGSDTGERFAIVHHVHKDTPAAVAGITRGDVIVAMNGGPITDANRSQLQNADHLTLSVTRFDSDGRIDPNAREVSMSSAEKYLDPIVEKKIIADGAHRIGYMYYSDFVSTSTGSINAHKDLTDAIIYFAGEGVTDFILDLRTNGGGSVATALLLGSLIAPRSAVQSESVLSVEIWATKTVSLELDKNVTANINLPGARPTIYILTNRYSASASEMIIAGLMPYMNVVHIGEETTGKFYGGNLLNLGNSALNDPALSNWALYAMLFRFTNSEGFPGINDVIAPAAANVVEDNFLNLLPLGSEDDPHIAKALTLITGRQWAPSAPLRAPSAAGARFVPTGLLPAGVPHGTLIDITE